MEGRCIGLEHIYSLGGFNQAEAAEGIKVA